jgi:drug/metabolite transporter (DMT)-like permease
MAASGRPVGAAFYAWDYGVKNGDIQIIGAASYAAPLLSTLILVASGFAEANWNILLACLLITGGAVLAARDMFRPKPIAEAVAE